MKEIENMDMSRKFRRRELTPKQAKDGIQTIYEFEDKGIHPNVSFLEFNEYYLVNLKELNTDSLDLSTILHCFVCSRFFDKAKPLRFSENKEFSFEKYENFNYLCTKIRELYPKGRSVVIL